MLKYARNYHTSEIQSCAFPSLRFYSLMAGILSRAGRIARNGTYTGDDWVQSSQEVGDALEATGAQLHIEGVEHITALESPCVFVANHMSTLETFFLPCIIQPIRDVTFVVKASLLKYPCLGPVLKSRDPLVVGRKNPREDLNVVLDGGGRHLASGRSVIIFPQGTRSHTVDSGAFSSLGVKLARKAKVPVVPIALKTDAWGTGTIIKDIGWIRPELPVHIRFGAPVSIAGNGKAEHEEIVAYICDWHERWIQEVQTKETPR